MARGFESKDVEFQQEEADRSRRPTPPLPPADRARQTTAQSLGLALTRARAELAATTSPIRRETLACAIADLEGRLAASQAPTR